MIKVASKFTPRSWRYFNSLFNYKVLGGRPHHYVDLALDAYIFSDEDRLSDMLVLYSDERNWACPVVYFRKDEDKEVGLSIPLELMVPSTRFLTDPILNFGNIEHPGFCEESPFSKIGICVDPNAIPEAWIECTEQHLSGLKNFSRQYDTFLASNLNIEFCRCSEDLFDDLEACLYPDYQKYWKDKKSPKSPGAGESYLRHLARNEELWCCRIWTLDEAGDYKDLAAAYFTCVQKDDHCKVTNWLESRRALVNEPHIESLGLGNVLLYYTAKQLSQEQLYFKDHKPNQTTPDFYPVRNYLSLGIGWIDYKKRWKPFMRYKSGFSVTNQNLFEAFLRSHKIEFKDNFFTGSDD